MDDSTDGVQYPVMEMGKSREGVVCHGVSAIPFVPLIFLFGGHCCVSGVSFVGCKEDQRGGSSCNCRAGTNNL